MKCLQCKADSISSVRHYVSYLLKRTVTEHSVTIGDYYPVCLCCDGCYYNFTAEFPWLKNYFTQVGR